MLEWGLFQAESGGDLLLSEIRAESRRQDSHIARSQKLDISIKLLSESRHLKVCFCLRIVKIHMRINMEVF